MCTGRFGNTVFRLGVRTSIDKIDLGLIIGAAPCPIAISSFNRNGLSIGHRSMAHVFLMLFQAFRTGAPAQGIQPHLPIDIVPWGWIAWSSNRLSAVWQTVLGLQRSLYLPTLWTMCTLMGTKMQAPQPDVAFGGRNLTCHFSPRKKHTPNR